MSSNLLLGFLYSDPSWDNQNKKKAQRYFLKVLTCITCLDYRLFQTRMSKNHPWEQNVIQANPDRILRNLGTLALSRAFSGRPIPKSVIKVGWDAFKAEVGIQTHGTSSQNAIFPPKQVTFWDLLSEHEVYSFFCLLYFVMSVLMFLVAIPTSLEDNLELQADYESYKLCFLSALSKKVQGFFLKSSTRCFWVPWAVLQIGGATLVWLLLLQDGSYVAVTNNLSSEAYMDALIIVLLPLTIFWFCTSARCIQWIKARGGERSPHEELPQALLVSLIPFLLIMGLSGIKRIPSSRISFAENLYDTLIPMIATFLGTLLAGILFSQPAVYNGWQNPNKKEGSDQQSKI